MNLKRAFAILVSFSALAIVGCPAQPTPTTGYQTVWTWTAPTTGSCTSNCSYIVSTLAVTSGTSTCPPATGQYVPQQTSTTALTTTTWTQTGTTGKSICAVVSTIFAGATSPASSPSNVATSPALPTAPGVPSGNAQQAELIKPTLSEQPMLVSKNLGMPTLMIGKVQRMVR